MSENIQNPSVLGTAHSLQLPLPVVNNAASLTGSVCNYSNPSTPGGRSAWLLPSDGGISFQPLMGSAYLDQHSSTTMLPGVSDQSQLSTLSASDPSVLESDIAGSTEKKSNMEDFTVTRLDQDTNVSSMSMASCYEKTLDTNHMVSLYPSLSASLVERTPPQVPNQSYSLSLPYQEGSQVIDYHQDTQGPLLSGESGPFLQSNGSMTYKGGRGSALQAYSNASPEMVMVLREVQPPKNQPPASSSGISYSVPTSPSTESSYQENIQNPSVLGTAHSLQLPLPVVNNAASLTGSVCNYSNPSTPGGRSAWLLPSDGGISFQPLMGSAYLDQHSSTTMLSGVSDQSQLSTLSASDPSVLESDIAGSTEKKSNMEDFTVTRLDQDTNDSSMSIASCYEKTLDTNHMVSLYPSLSASLVERTPPQVPNQSYSLSLPYQEGSQVIDYHQDTQGPLLSGESGPFLQSNDWMTYKGGRGSALQAYSNASPEMVMILKEVQPPKNQPPASSSGICYSVPAPPITESSYQVMNSLSMETSLARQPPDQLLESHPPPELLDVFIIDSAQNDLALHPAPSQEEIDTNLDEMNIGLSKSPDTYQFPIENQDPLLCPLEIPDINELLDCIYPLSKEQQPGTLHQEKSGQCLEDTGRLESKIESDGIFADILTWVEDKELPQLFDCLQDLDQDIEPQGMNTTDTITLNQGKKHSGGTKGTSHPKRKKKNQASEPLEGEPKAKIHTKDPVCLLGEAGIVCNAAVSDKCPVTMAKHNSKHQKAASSRISKTKSHGQEKTKKTRENSEKSDYHNQTGDNVKPEEKSTTARMKRKLSQPELCQDSLKKPRSCLGMQMRESVQAFGALGKKSELMPGSSSSWVLSSSKKPKDVQPSTAVKPWPSATGHGKGLEKPQVKASKPSSSAEEDSDPSLYELPPPGKVKLIPLPFLTMEKPQPRRVRRRPQTLASHRPAAAYPARPASTVSAQPSATNTSRPATASFSGPARLAQPISTNPSRPALLSSTSRPTTQSATSRPAPYKTTASTSLQQGHLLVSGTKRQAPPKGQSQFLLQDSRFQPIPCRKPNVLEPVKSKAVTKEQRPEREVMKRKAQ